MVLENKKIQELIKKGPSEKILLARSKARHRNMHVTGKGMIQYLESLDSYETPAQKTLREKLAKSNRSNFSFILRPTDKIFTAKGGAINYNLPQKEVDYIKDKLGNIADGLEIKKYLKKKVKKEYIVDPNGVLFVDINEQSNIETYVINTENILWYEAKGNSVEAIIFEPYEKEEDRLEFLSGCGIKDSVMPPQWNYVKKYYRVIDDTSDRIFIRESKNKNDGNPTDEVYEQPRSSFDNYFGYVPALILGDEKCNNTGIFESIIEDLLDDADILLRRMSIMNVHELAHLYPRYWSYAQACTRCGGEGTLPGSPKPDTDPQEFNPSTTCPSCGGTGHKTRTNPSDETVVPVPQEGDHVLNKLMGFESPDLQTAKFYDNIISGSRVDMFRAMWGTTFEVGGKQETATGRFLDVQPVNDRLGDMSYTFAKMHKFLLDCYGVVLLRDPKYQSSVTYGRRYMFEGPDDILNKYIEVSREKLSDVMKLDLGYRYIDAEYQDDPVEMVKKKKLYKIEPFPTLSVDSVMGLQALPDDEKLKKLYFGEWSNQLKDSELIFDNEDVLKEKLNIYINQKQLNNVIRG